MASKKRASLGRGLDHLLSTPVGAVMEAAIEQESPNESRPKGNLQELPLDIIQRGKYQPRKDLKLEALEELSSSIKTQGILQPIVVRPIGQGRYEIIAGERRWRASQMAGLEKIPAIVREVSDEVTMALALIENMQREDLNPIEQAVAIKRLSDECGMTHEEIANTLGKSRASITNLLRLNSLVQEVKDLIIQGDLNLGHAKVLLALEGDQQVKAARITAARNLSVRETEMLVKRMQGEQNPKQKPELDPDVLQLQDMLTERLSSKVRIQHSVNKDKGKLVIHYRNLNELDKIIEHII